MSLDVTDEARVGRVGEVGNLDRGRAGEAVHYLVGFPTRDAPNSFRLYAALVSELGIESTGGF